MPYPQRRFRILSLPVFGILLVGLVFLSRFYSPLSSVQDQWIHRLSSPLLSSLASMSGGVKDFFTHYVALSQASRENEELKKEVARLKNELIAVKLAKAKEDRGLEVARFVEKNPYQIQRAEVIAFDALPSRKSILINKGERAGIKRGQAVISPEGAVGVVVKTYSEDALVLLLVDATSVVDGEVLSSGARGLIRGRRVSLGFNRDFWLTRMEYLGQSDEVREGDQVITSGLDQIFPKGIMLGRIQKIYRDPRGLFISADLLPEVDFSKLSEVMVIQK